jgi:succinyl-CoA synthetase beta subunit
LKIHEYQAKSVLARFGVPVPRGEVISNAAEAAASAERLGGSVVVVKAQIHAGGRGKGGGVKLAKSPDEAERIARQMIGMTLVTHQTGSEGRKVGRVLIEEGVQIERELYLSMLIDRAAGQPVVIASAAGGMDIEEVAATHPEKILREHVDPATGVIPFRRASSRSRWALTAGPQERWSRCSSRSIGRYRTDASMIEINPLILTKAGDLLALDAKVTFDDNALYRHPDLRELRDLSRRGSAGGRGVEVLAQLHPPRRQHRLHGQRRRPRDGDDGHHQAGGRRAGELSRCRRRRQRGTDQERVPHLMADKNVKAVFINIFGGILRCDILAAGVIAAVRELGVPVPIVIRMEGTNVEEGKRMLRESGLNFTTADSMSEGAERVVALAGAADGAAREKTVRA